MRFFSCVQRSKREKKKFKKNMSFYFNCGEKDRVFFNREKLFVLPLFLVVVLSCHVEQIVKLHTRSTEIPIWPFLFKESCHWFQWQFCLIKENWIGPWSNGVLSLSLLFWPLTITFKELEAIVAPAVFQGNKQNDKNQCHELFWVLVHEKTVCII